MAVHYAELHFHLLPGVDDGPSSLQESVALARAAAAEGTRTILATPHVNRHHVGDVSGLPDLVEEVAARLRRARLPIHVECGAELGHEMVERLSDLELETVASGPPGRRWILLEASPEGLDEAFTAAADELRDRGFAVVVAHPERSLLDRAAGWRALAHELAAGSGVQVNAWSVAGCYGDRVRRDALRVLHAAPGAAVASDAHGPSRMPALRLALDALAAAGDPAPVRRVEAIPQALLRFGLPAPRAVAA